MRRFPTRRLRGVFAALVLVLTVVAPATATAAAELAVAVAVAARPVGLRLVAAAHDQISIAWDDPGDASINGYQILRRLRDSYAVGRFDVVADDTGTADTAYTDAEVTPSTRYVYRVKAINSADTSRQSTYPPPPR